MPRTITTAMLSAITGKSFAPVIFVQMQFISATIYVWSGIGTITWNSQTWTGVGSLLSIGNVEDGATVNARGIAVLISGIDPTLLPNALNDVQLGLPVTIWFGALSAPGVVIADPLILWSGGIDQPTIEVSGESATISFACENLLVGMNVAVDRRYNSIDQQSQWPGDLGMIFVDALQEMTLYWGTTAVTTTNI